MKHCKRCNAEFATPGAHWYLSGKYFVCKEGIKANQRRYRERNPERVLEIEQASRQKHREKKCQYSQEHYEANKDAILARKQKHYRNNKEKYLAKDAKRRTKKKQQTPEMSILEADMINALYWTSRVLSNSCNERFHVDHIQPISKGGLHCFENLQVLSAAENLRKGNK